MPDLDLRPIYVTWVPRIRRYLARLVGSGDADDLTQDVFARAERSLPTLRNEARLSTWLYRIATNAALDRMRSPGFGGRAAPDVDVDGPEAAACGGDEPQDAEARAIQAEMRRCILDVVANLPESQRAAVLLCDVQELTDREAATALGVSVEALKIRLHRGRKRLRGLLRSKCDFYRDERNAFACEAKPPSPRSC